MQSDAILRGLTEDVNGVRSVGFVNEMFTVCIFTAKCGINQI